MDFNNDSGLLSNVSVITPISNTLTLSGTGGLVPFTGSTSQRPTSPVLGTSRFNTDINNTEYWNGTSWQKTVLLIDDCTDVAISNPSNGQLLQFNGTSWINATSSPSSVTGILSTWTLVSNNRYYNTFIHNLNTTNVIVQLYDNVSNTLIQADSVVVAANSVTVTIIGHTAILRIVVIANGLSVSSTGSGIQEGLFSQLPAVGNVGALYLAYDTKVLYRDSGTSWVIIMSSGGTVKSYTFYATSLDSPNSSDYAVNAIAPVNSDPINTSIDVRTFSRSVEQGVGCTMPIPLGANTITFSIRGRAATAQGIASNVQHNLYVRQIPNNTALGSWSTATSFSPFVIPANNYYQQYSQTYSLSTLGLIVGNSYQMELTRAVSGLNSAWLVTEITISFA
jgi:hypothetical protein